MRITFVLPSFQDHPIGGYKAVFEYANGLIRFGHSAQIVFLWTPPPPSSHRLQIGFISRLNQHKMQLVYERRKPSITWFALHPDVKLVKATSLQSGRMLDADAIFATAWHTAAIVNECPAEKGTKFYLVMDFAPWMGEQSELEQSWRLPLKKIAISSWLAELVMSAGVPREDIEAIPIAIDQTHFRIINSVQGRAKRVAMLYSSKTYKRSQLGLSVLERCRDAVPNLEASLFGPLERRPPAPPSWCDYYGSVSESKLVSLYNEASIYLCSSAVEGFALPPAEAMACGCAVVTTDCGGNRDYAQHEKTALVSDADDFTSLMNNVLLLLSDEELRVKIARAGNDRIAEFTWEKSTRRLLEFVNRHC